MIRMQGQLTREQAEAVKRMAAERGVSAAEIIRRSVDAYVQAGVGPAPSELRKRALRVIGIAHGPTDLSERHDDYLGEAFRP
jgi:hypothetical protein